MFSSYVPPLLRKAVGNQLGTGKSVTTNLVQIKNDTNETKIVVHQTSKSTANISEQMKNSEDDKLVSDLKLIPVSGDGNCMFRTLSYGLYGTDAFYAEIRHQIVSHVVANFEEEKNYPASYLCGEDV